MMRNVDIPSAETYNCFFKKHGGRKDVESALKLYKRRHEGLCFPSSMNSYNLLVGMFLKLNRGLIARYGMIWRRVEIGTMGC